MKAVSVVVPVYNVGHYIKKTISSLINQTCKDFEIVLIDDGSTDNSIDMAIKMLSKQSLISVKTIVQENQGVSVARNNGLENACGQYILFLDADDYIGENTVKEIKLYADKQYDFLFWKYYKITKNKQQLYHLNKQQSLCKFQNNNEILKKVINGEVHLWTGNIAYRKNFLIDNKIKYTPKCMNGEDLEFIFMAVIQSNEIEYVDNISSYYVNRENSISNTFNIRKFDAILAFNRVKKQLELMNNSQFLIKEFENKVILVEFLNTLVDSYKQSDKGFFEMIGYIDNIYTQMLGNIYRIAIKNIFTKQKLKTKIKMIIFIFVFIYQNKKIVKNK